MYEVENRILGLGDVEWLERKVNGGKSLTESWEGIGNASPGMFDDDETCFTPK